MGLVKELQTKAIHSEYLNEGKIVTIDQILLFKAIFLFFEML